MRIPLSTTIKTRTGVPAGKDARLVNSYVEVKGENSIVRKRPSAQGGVSVGTGTAQGGIGFTLNGTDYIYTVNGDVGALDTLSSAGTSWSSGASYVIGDHVSVAFVDYWAIADNTNNNPSSSPSYWSMSYVIKPEIRQAVDSYGWGVATGCIPAGSGYSTALERSNAFIALINSLPCANGNGAYVYYTCAEDPENQMTYSNNGGALVACYAPSFPSYTSSLNVCPTGYTYSAILDACVLD